MGAFDRERLAMLVQPEEDLLLGLKRVPRVATYRGFIFASAAPSGPSLQAFLGPITVSFDDFVDRGQRLWGALVEHRLRRAGDAFRIARKRVDLANSEGELDGIAILF